MNSKTQQAIDGQAACLLSNNQKRDLILIAQKAYATQQKSGLVDEDFDTWRKAVCWDIAQKASFRTLSQRDYARVLAEFSKLAGHKVNTGIVTRTQGTDDARRANWKLERILEEVAEVFGNLDGARAYADSLFTSIHKTERAHASAQQVWQVIFTILRRAKAKKHGG